MLLALVVLAVIAGWAGRTGPGGNAGKTASTATSAPSPSIAGTDGTSLEGSTSAGGPPTGDAPTVTTSLTPADPLPGQDPASLGNHGATAAVDRLVVVSTGGALAPYRRAMFGDGWDYDPATGCNTRERVLIAESVVPATVDDRCRPTGRWRSAYDGVVTTDIAVLEIDHLVPLADAWRSGAAAWTFERREAFANDLADPHTLIAVSSRTNRSKSDSTPDQWLPPDRDRWCTYASDWVEIKARWHLSVTPAEKATLVQVLGGC